jgi:hypothetical protein
MSQRQKKRVSEIVEEYRNRFPEAKRQLIRDAILKKHNSISIRTLNRHLKKEFDKAQSFTKISPNVTKRISLWNRLLLKLEEAGVSLFDIEIQKLELGEPDPITGWFEKIYDKILPVKGVIILKGAKELEIATSIFVSKEYLGFLLTQGAVEECDRFRWRGNIYVIQEVEEVIDGYDLGYRIAKLVWQYNNKLN